ncbi:hypothetical protein [Komagataeibacter kakiaceti]|uniref:hypothetical protein n=1 Tax=Komagataeibacter kakiaceti TaxID=943261 RepID=UPI0004711213|nr:hypothetical protein [Komagataeibacter kakiaceti]
MAGGTPTPDDEARSQGIVGIDVIVTDISGTRALRHAVITTQVAGGDASPVRILQWNRPDDY